MFSRDSDKIPKSTTSQSVIGVEMQTSGNIKCSGNLVLKGKLKATLNAIISIYHPKESSKETSNH